ncbi:MAG: hypothetical protein IT226_15075 [Flavobacteriales bacterium]|nr:hypothetical protein [Flavobacteriales bacterium]
MWVILAEFGFWIALVLLVMGIVLYSGPILLLRWVVNWIGGRGDKDIHRLEQEADELLGRLRKLNFEDLQAHPQQGPEILVDLSGRKGRLYWGLHEWYTSDIHVVVSYHLRPFEWIRNPETMGAVGFKILPNGERAELTMEELGAYT